MFMSAVRSICGPGGSGSRFRARAQLSHRCASRFFLFTMSVRCTVAGLSQNIHFMRLPCASRQESPLGRFFQLLDLVPHAGRFLVVLLVDQRLESLAELGEFGLGGLGSRGTSRSLADVPDIAVDAFHEREQVGFEGVVVVWASEPAVVAELQEGQPAGGTAGAGRD